MQCRGVGRPVLQIAVTVRIASTSVGKCNEENAHRYAPHTERALRGKAALHPWPTGLPVMSQMPPSFSFQACWRPAATAAHDLRSYCTLRLAKRHRSNSEETTKCHEKSVALVADGTLIENDGFLVLTTNASLRTHPQRRP